MMKIFQKEKKRPEKFDLKKDIFHRWHVIVSIFFTFLVLEIALAAGAFWYLSQEFDKEAPVPELDVAIVVPEAKIKQAVEGIEKRDKEREALLAAPGTVIDPSK